MSRARPRTRRGPFPARRSRWSAAATNVSGRIHLTWLAPAFDGGTQITDYVIERSPHGANTWTMVADGVSVALSFDVGGLTPLASYDFRVLAVNDVGPGPASNVATAAPHGVPSAPRSLAAAPTNVSGQVRLTWLAPLSNGGSAVTDYIVQRSPNGTTGWTTISDGVNTNTAYTATGLVNGTRYYFRVFAHNAVGNGPASNVANAIPRTLPTAARSLTASLAGTGMLRLAWLAPTSNGGSAVTDYIIQRSPNGTTGWATISDGVNTNTAYTATGLVNGTRYYFRVFAHNAVGNSPTSNVANAVPVPVPTAPRSLAAAPTNRVGPGPSDLGGAAVERRVGGHRLHHPALAQRHHRLDDDQRRRQRQHDVHGRPGWSTAPATTSGSTPTTPSATARPATSPTPSRAPCRPPPVR